MDKDKGPRDQVFLVRIWPAQQPDSRRAWRGSVQHVHSGRRLYFSGLVDVVEFITNELSEPTPDERSSG